MKLLLDTHAFIWALTDSKRLTAAARNAVTSTENEIYVSSISFWEIAIKLRNNRMSPIGHEPSTLVEAAEAMGLITIALTPDEAATRGNLTEDTHFDPFDRMLIWQAIERRMMLISADKAFQRFVPDGLELLWD